MTVFLMRRQLGQRHIKKEDHVKTEREDNYQQCNMRNDQKKPSLPHINLRCAASRTVSTYILLFQLLGLRYFFMVALAD